MIGTTPQVFDIQTVRTLRPANGALALTFQSGLVAWLRPDHPDRDALLRDGEDSIRQGLPVGVMVDGEGRLLELSPTFATGVRSVREDEEDPSRLAVWCWEFSPVCYLTRNHPEFERIRATLAEAAGSGRQVWLANRMHLVEGETEIWWKILDVRPMEALPEGR
jgi:hypothetical protein